MRCRLESGDEIPLQLRRQDDSQASYQHGMIDPNRMYSIPELSVVSGWSENTVRTMFRYHPMVQKKAGPTRQRVAVRIPGTTALQVMQDLQREPTVVKIEKPKKDRRKVYLNPSRHRKAIARAEALTPASVIEEVQAA